MAILKEAYNGLKEIYKESGNDLPKNKNDNRKLDSAVFKYLHKSRKETSGIPFDTIRYAFNEGEPIYPGANFTARLHIEICVLNPDLILGYFLPYPL